MAVLHAVGPTCFTSGLAPSCRERQAFVEPQQQQQQQQLCHRDSVGVINRGITELLRMRMRV